MIENHSKEIFDGFYDSDSHHKNWPIRTFKVQSDLKCTSKQQT